MIILSISLNARWYQSLCKAFQCSDKTVYDWLVQTIEFANVLAIVKANIGANLTDEQVEAVRDLFAKGKTADEIIAMLNTLKASNSSTGNTPNPP
jgi:hypothetical protein